MKHISVMKIENYFCVIGISLKNITNEAGAST